MSKEKNIHHSLVEGDNSLWLYLFRFEIYTYLTKYYCIQEELKVTV